MLDLKARVDELDQRNEVPKGDCLTAIINEFLRLEEDLANIGH